MGQSTQPRKWTWDFHTRLWVHTASIFVSALSTGPGSWLHHVLQKAAYFGLQGAIKAS